MKRVNCILLVDDNVHDNFFHILNIGEACASEQVKTALDGEKALEYLENTKKDPVEFPFPDIIFLDINMPKINGFEFLEKAIDKKLITKNNPVTIIMLTSSLNPNDEKMAKEKFSDEIIEFRNKPLTVEMLNEITERYFPHVSGNSSSPKERENKAEK